MQGRAGQERTEQLQSCTSGADHPPPHFICRKINLTIVIILSYKQLKKQNKKTQKKREKKNTLGGNVKSNIKIKVTQDHEKPLCFRNYFQKLQ